MCSEAYIYIYMILRATKNHYPNFSCDKYKTFVSFSNFTDQVLKTIKKLSSMHTQCEHIAEENNSGPNTI